MTSITIDLPEGILAALRKSPGEIEKDLLLAVAIEWYRRGALSQGRAAELAGLSRADFLAALAERRIDVVEVDLEEAGRESLRARLIEELAGSGLWEGDLSKMHGDR